MLNVAPTFRPSRALPPPEVQKFGSDRLSCTLLPDCFSNDYERFHGLAVSRVGVSHLKANMDIPWRRHLLE